MATITEPIILDETGQDIVTKLNNINTQVTALNALIADLGLVSITPISQADYDDLSPTDKLNGVFDIYDAVEPMIDGDSVSYDSNTTIKQKVDIIEVKKKEFTLSSGSTTSVSYPTGKGKDSMHIVGFAFYRNYSWYFDNKAVACVCSNNEIIVEVDNSYSYIQGLPAKILYV